MVNSVCAEVRKPASCEGLLSNCERPDAETYLVAKFERSFWMLVRSDWLGGLLPIFSNTPTTWPHGPVALTIALNSWHTAEDPEALSSVPRTGIPDGSETRLPRLGAGRPESGSPLGVPPVLDVIAPSTGMLFSSWLAAVEPVSCESVGREPE